MSNKYLSTDPDIMAESARRFHTLFGFYPECIGVHIDNKEAKARTAIKFPVLSKYHQALMSEKPTALYDLSPSIMMQEIAIKPYDGVLFNDFVLWSEKTGAITPTLVFDVNGYAVVKMIDALGYRCVNYKYRCANYSMSYTDYDLFTVRDKEIKDLYINMPIYHHKYEYPEQLRDFLEKAIITRFKQAKQPQNKSIAEFDVKVNFDGSELIKYLKDVKQVIQSPEHPNCKTTTIEETSNTMATLPEKAKAIFPINGEMYELELNVYNFTQEVDRVSGLTCHFEGDSIKPAKPLKKKDPAGTLTLNGTKYELNPVTE